MVTSSSPDMSFYKASTLLSQATYLLHRSWALPGSLWYRKCLRKWTYMKILQRQYCLVTFVSDDSLLYHQLLGFSFPS